MSNPVLHKYRDITPLSDDATTDAMLRILVDIHPQEQQRWWIKNQNVGFVCIFTHEKFPGKVIEYVQGSQEDSVTTLYDMHPIFADLARLEQVRNELITEIGVTLMALPASVLVYDAGREREAPLKELGTAQLMDVLAHFTGTDLKAS